MESGAEQDTGAGEVDKVTDRKVGSKRDCNWPGAGDGDERCSVFGFHGLIVKMKFLFGLLGIRLPGARRWLN